MCSTRCSDLCWSSIGRACGRVLPHRQRRWQPAARRACLVTLDGVLIDGHGTMVGGAQKGRVRRSWLSVASCASWALKWRTWTSASEPRKNSSSSAKELSHLQESSPSCKSRASGRNAASGRSTKTFSKGREEHSRVCHRLEVMGREHDELSSRRDEMVREAEETGSRCGPRVSFLETLELQRQKGTAAARSVCSDTVEKLGQRTDAAKSVPGGPSRKVVATERALSRLREEEVERQSRIERLGGEERDSL